MSRAKIIGMIAVIVGICLFLYPDFKTYKFERDTQRVEQEIDGRTELYNQEEDLSGDKQEVILPNRDIYLKMQEYNQTLYETGQASFIDAWSVTQIPEEFAEYEKQAFGYIDIPSMDVSLPLYLGATNAHMSKGAAVLGSTSIPIGGDNTNAVIAGHRGYKGIPFFRDIEKIQVGDMVYIRNTWETLSYQVLDIAVIDPYDSDKVKLQEGKDMITLLTCHPYRSHGKYRYVVYCVRADEKIPVVKVENLDTEQLEDDLSSISSVKDIECERLLRKGCAMVLIGILMVTIVQLRIEQKKFRKEKACGKNQY